MFPRWKKKIFVIGLNKTGTTSMAAVLKSLGYKLGHQAPAELLLYDWAKRDFRSLIRYCRSADAFQDIPFSLDYAYVALDNAFPGSRFILTVRDSAEQWLRSLSRYHTEKVGKGRLPTAEDLRQHPYRKVGWLWDYHRLVHGADEHTLYDHDSYVRHYELYNERVREYFRWRPADLLEVNLSDSGAAGRIAEFLGVPPSKVEIPHLNASH